MDQDQGINIWSVRVDHHSQLGVAGVPDFERQFERKAGFREIAALATDEIHRAFGSRFSSRYSFRVRNRPMLAWLCIE